MQEKLLYNLEKKNSENEYKLNSLLEITKAINSNQSVEELCKIFHLILEHQLGITKFLLYDRQNDWSILLKHGIKGNVEEIDVTRDLFVFKEITLIESSFSKVLSQFDVIVPVYLENEPLAFLLLAGLDKLHTNRITALNEMSFIQTLTNIIVVAVENRSMAKLGIIQERIRKELEIASEMQKMLFPSDLPSNKKMDISAKYIPRHEVGGDYYDFIQLNDDEYIICIADVSGKGISAALLMANFQATIRTLFAYQRFDLPFLIEELNKKVMKSTKGEKFITFFIAHYNIHSRELNYINAGHNAPILTNGKKIELLEKGCIGLGMFDEIPFINEGRVTLKKNTTLVLFTDGIVELENENDEFFELNRLIKLVHAYYPIKMEDLNNIIFSKLDEWRGSRDFDDDTAIFCCRFF